MDCIFCEIISGKSGASHVYEDEATIAFMNLRQANPGHVLVVPKAHVETIYELTDLQAAQLFQTVVMISRAIRKSLKPGGLSLFQANEAASQQEVQHVHFHLLPRWKGDGLLRFYPEVPPHMGRFELDDIAGLIRESIKT
ncbi:MAG: HIT domain-containing protein [Anaerolineales bacterium]|jgi:histidine triad (HIT) family protein